MGKNRNQKMGDANPQTIEMQSNSHSCKRKRKKRINVDHMIKTKKAPKPYDMLQQFSS